MSNSVNQNDFRFIDTADALLKFCNEIASANELAIDTEFIREKSYYSQLCLIQIASHEHIACIDPLAVADIGPLLDILYDSSKTKILHAARQDLEIFFNLREDIPKPIFDTQIAATVLGYGDQIGYSKLVEEFLDIHVEKGHARTDWSQRPLSKEQLNYAANDVRYLIQIYPMIKQRLDELGRSDWPDEDFQALCSPDLYRINSETIWQRISGHQRLKGNKLAILQRLAAWREELAVTQNRPRKWILADDVMVALTQQAPSSVAQLKTLRGLAPRVLEKYGQDILDMIEQAKQLPKDQWPCKDKLQRPSSQQEALTDGLMSLLKIRAAENSITASALANRKDIEQLVMGEQDLPLLHGWRAQLVGNDLVKMLKGELKLQVISGKLTVLNSDD
ncbi:MAG: ribonuclease D [Gammaproteobacteria bacterium]|nr:ribonuclease D [Gammaproteobacteria bacterium]